MMYCMFKYFISIRNKATLFIQIANFYIRTKNYLHDKLLKSTSPLITFNLLEKKSLGPNPGRIKQ